MTEDNNLKTLREECEKLLQLLKENETGLFTWHMFVDQSARRLRDMLNDAYDPDKILSQT